MDVKEVIAALRAEEAKVWEESLEEEDEFKLDCHANYCAGIAFARELLGDLSAVATINGATVWLSP